MTHITYSPIDRQFRTLERDLPPGAPFNGIDPLDGITFGFALASRYPLSQGVPDVRYGTVEGEVEDDPAIGLRVVSEAEYDAAYEAEMAAREAQAQPVISMVSPFLYAAAQLTIADGEVSGVGINSRFSGAFPLGTGQTFVMFYEPLPDTQYMAMATAIGPGNAYVFPADKYEDGFMITATDALGDPFDISAVNISIVRA